MSDRIEAEILDVFGEEVAAAVDTPLVVIEGPKGDTGDAGKDGHSPVVTAAKSGKTTTISVDGAAIATVEDGADGADGQNGAPGAKGADGITPTIGANGHWYLGPTDTGKPSRGEKGEKGDPGKDGANGETGPAGPRGEKGADGSNGKDGKPGEKGADGTPGIYYGTTPPTGDTHPVWIDPNGDHDDGGLLPAVTAADNGKVLRVVGGAWSPADMPSGGGVDKPAVKIIDTEITEKTLAFEANNLQGVSAIVAIWSGICNETGTNSGLDLQINDVRIASFGFIKNAQKDFKLYGYSIAQLVNGFWVCSVSAGAISGTDNTTMSNTSCAYNLVPGVGAASKIAFTASSKEYAPVTGKLEVWAR